MGYNENKIPHFVRGLLEEYDDVEFNSCAASGDWVSLSLNGREVRLYKEDGTDFVRAKQKYKGLLKFYDVEMDNYNNTLERDKVIGKALMEVMGGYESAEEAFEDNFS